jgi:hypothetical protein
MWVEPTHLFIPRPQTVGCDRTIPTSQANRGIAEPLMGPSHLRAFARLTGAESHRLVFYD